MHSAHFPVVGLYPRYCFIGLHVMLVVPPRDFTRHTSFDKHVSFLYFWLLNDFLWFPYLSFHGGSLIPLYSLNPYLGKLDFIVASYNRLGVVHSPGIGHSSGSLQLHSPGVSSTLSSKILLLWALIEALMLGIQP